MLTREFDYIVRPGDTLFGIALKFNVPFDTLKNLNHLPDPDRIQPGQVIQVPVSEEFYQIVRLVEEQCGLAQPSDAAAEATAAAVETAAQCDCDEQPPAVFYRRHRIRRGDTVYLLAKEYGTTTGNILSLNPQITDVRNLQIGSIISIPVPPENSYIYVVRPGDTLYSIAQSQGVTVEDLMRYNYIESDYTVYPGQQLLIVK